MYAEPPQAKCTPSPPKMFKKNTKGEDYFIDKGRGKRRTLEKISDSIEKLKDLGPEEVEKKKNFNPYKINKYQVMKNNMGFINLEQLHT